MGFLNYVCKNCDSTTKVYAIAIFAAKDTKNWKTYKFGEMPPFGPLTPAKVIELIGPDKNLFLLGRRAENQGMGIGAFTYYRRVVENQKNRILNEIIRVSKKIHVDPKLITTMEGALEETQFSKAITSVREAIPPVLLINGFNPLTLLHSALSEGLHAQSDNECLELAKSIRVLLTELADRLQQALKEETELQNAVNRLLQAKSIKKNEQKVE